MRHSVRQGAFFIVAATTFITLRKSIIMDDLIALRRHLHAHPELSNEEHDTTKEIRSRLQALSNPPELISLGGTGFAAVFRPSDAEEGHPKDSNPADAKKILLRFELDALPITEVNSFDHKSVHDNVSHKCGHDGHMTILFGVAQWLSEHLPKDGEAILLFQSAEETGDGAKEAIEHANFSRLNPDRVIALHNLPGRPMHHVFLRNGTITPSIATIYNTKIAMSMKCIWITGRSFEVCRKLGDAAYVTKLRTGSR